jgi:DinB superfamily
MAQSIPAPLLYRSPATEEWSALECLQHLTDAEQSVFPVRVVRFLERRDFPAFDPDSEGTKVDDAADAPALANECGRLRRQSLALLAKLTPADLPRTACHQELGLVTLEQLLHEWAAHDLMHTVQAERALMQPFIEGCGPWLPYFAAHVAAKS